MSSSYKIHLVTSISEVDAAQWDACANPASLLASELAETDSREADLPELQPAALDMPLEAGNAPAANSVLQKERFNPFITHAFLKALETSGSVGAKSGWTPTHVIVEDATGRALAVAPTYLKTHSMVIRLRSRLGRCLSSRRAAILSEGAGRRALYAGEGGAFWCRLKAGEQALNALIVGLRSSAREDRRLLDPCDLSDEERMGCARPQRLSAAHRAAVSFHQQRLCRFRGFLAHLTSRKRKMIRRERKDALAQAGGIEIELLTGSAITEAHWDAFFLFYQDTGNRTGHPISSAPSSRRSARR